MCKSKFTERTLKALTAVLLVIALIQTFTVSDYYIFNRFSSFNPAFIISQWIKKAGLLTLPLAVFLGRRSCSDISRYLLPPFVIISLFTFGGFFDVTRLTDSATAADRVYASINEFIPKAGVQLMFFVSAELYLAICALLFARDGFAVKIKSFRYLPAAILGTMPLNIFENFFDIADFPIGHPLRFGNYTIWHGLAVIFLFGLAACTYLFLRNKSEDGKDKYLAAAVIVLLIQYHSKDSVIMGDGYNVYHTVFACIPLFICNIGMYVVALTIFLKKKTLYAISYFVHSAGAISVYFYFGRPEISDYGIFCSYSILYFVFTHSLLFTLSLMPAALGRYKFRHRDALVPLVYYCIVLFLAAIVSAIVTSASYGFTFEGYTLAEDEILIPNYSFTQINPLPFVVPEWVMLNVWRYKINVLYLLGLYAFYVAIFYAFNYILVNLFMLSRKGVKKLAAKIRRKDENTAEEPLSETESEAAAADENSP